ncbi:GA-like domain-containing protein, partial [Acinetobacter junii]|uniref:GA-like domain-containing protein n=1 Tax=Acinetobacter junii TaxID=40215 RepID=UPI0030F4F4C5
KDAQDAKDLAQDAVNALPAGTDRDGLQGRLDSLVDIVVPPVNDADSDGVEDTAAEQAATALVEEAEAAQEAAEELLAELQEDGLITPAEQAQLQA